uniref:hypothetical protein n=1 Tax=uncultured Draconibacterium sp. TaxID=1573823 RepID=UPI0032165F35
MDSIVFNEFWRLSKGVKAVRYKDSVYYNVENYKKLKLKPVGRYFDYLKKLGKDDEFFKSVHEAMEVAGDLSAGTAVTFPMKHQNLDFTIPKNRLWVAVFLLRIEEHSDKKMEKYFTGKKHTSNNL